MPLFFGSVDAIAGSDMSVHGQIECGSQYHFTMETQTALVVPDEDGYTVYSSTQWVSGIQAAVANVLGVPVNMYVSEFLGDGRFLFNSLSPYLFSSLSSTS